MKPSTADVISSCALVLSGFALGLLVGVAGEKTMTLHNYHALQGCIEGGC